jgi:hypothetical protein
MFNLTDSKILSSNHPNITFSKQIKVNFSSNLSLIVSLDKVKILSNNNHLLFSYLMEPTNKINKLVNFQNFKTILLMNNQRPNFLQINKNFNHNQKHLSFQINLQKNLSNQLNL